MTRRLSILLATLATMMLVSPAMAQTAAPATVAKTAIFITLGTGGGPFIRLKRAQPANAIVVNNVVYLFDAGNGVQRQLAGAKLNATNVRAVFVSHHHLDHNADVGAVGLNRWLVTAGRAPALAVVGPPGTKAMVDGIASAFTATSWAPITIGGPPQPPIASAFKATDMNAEMLVPELVYQDDNIRVTAVLNNHYNYPAGSLYQEKARSYAFRIEAGRRVFVFSGDTGPSERLTALAKDADVLVTEVIDLALQERMLKGSPVPPEMIPGLMAHLREDHLSPTDIGRMAAKAKVRKVVLTHFVPGMDIDVDTSGYTKGIDQFYRGPVVVANDLDAF